MNNVHRSDYVEAIVAVALEGFDWCRKEPWDGWDFEHTSGTRLEVKQSAAVQAWQPPKSGPSMPVFSISPAKGYWEGADWIESPGRHSQIYVFAWHEKTGDDADQRDPD